MVDWLISNTDKLPASIKDTEKFTFTPNMIDLIDCCCLDIAMENNDKNAVDLIFKLNPLNKDIIYYCCDIRFEWFQYFIEKNYCTIDNIDNKFIKHRIKVDDYGCFKYCMPYMADRGLKISDKNKNRLLKKFGFNKDTDLIILDIIYS